MSPANADISDLTNSRSQILEYLNCGYRWELGYPRGIHSTKVQEAMDGGSANHRAIKGAVRAYAAKGTRFTEKDGTMSAIDEVRAWSAEERKMRGKFLTGEMREQIRVLELDAVGIAKRAMELFDLPSWEVAKWKGQPFMEVEVITPLPPWKGYRTIPDLVARPRAEGKKAPFWLIDWKGKESFESEDAEEVNLQFASMQYVIEREIPDMKLDGSILWQVKPQAPREPSVNKNGSMSRQAIVTDWATYERCLKRASLNPKDYADMKEKIGMIEWFRAIKQHRTSEECDAVWNEIVVPAAREMATNPRTIRRWVHQPFACKGCWARQFCLAELRGEDTEFLLETDYIDTRAPRKRRQLGEPQRKFQLK